MLALCPCSVPARAHITLSRDRVWRLVILRILCAFFPSFHLLSLHFKSLFSLPAYPSLILLRFLLLAFTSSVHHSFVSVLPFRLPSFLPCFRTVASNNWFLHLRCWKCYTLLLFDLSLVKSRFSLCSGHQTVPKRSNFECFRFPALHSFTENVHRDPPSIFWSTQTENRALRPARRVLVYILREANYGLNIDGTLQRICTSIIESKPTSRGNCGDM